MNRAFLVLGPESSGTRWLTSILIAAGCSGDDGHYQPWDESLPNGEAPIVWRRSFPHGSDWPNLPVMLRELHQRGYTVTALVMARDWHAMTCSQRRFRNDDINANIQRAYRDIFQGMQSVPFVVVSYEAMLTRPDDYISWLLAYLELPHTVHVSVVDGNEKWY